MALPEIISPLSTVPEETAIVKPLLTEAEKAFLDMLAESFVKSIKEKK